jgi:hypothetical protein
VSGSTFDVRLDSGLLRERVEIEDLFRTAH